MTISRPCSSAMTKASGTVSLPDLIASAKIHGRFVVLRGGPLTCSVIQVPRHRSLVGPSYEDENKIEPFGNSDLGACPMNSIGSTADWFLHLS